MALEIEFLDGHPEMEVGVTARLRVLQPDAAGARHTVRLANVTFAFAPVEWGRVRETDDPAVGLLEVIETVEPEDLLLAPTYKIAASLTDEAGATIAPERRVRLLAPGPVEVELAFEVGQGQRFRRFAAGDLRRPIDWSRARVSDPERQSIVVREGTPYLRLTSLDALPAEVTIAFPNGEEATLHVEGGLRAHRGEVADPAPALESSAPAPRPTIEPPPAAAPAHDPLEDTHVERAPYELPPSDVAEEEVEEAAADGGAPQPTIEAPPTIEPPRGVDPAALREEVHTLRRYVTSFANALRAQPDGEAAEGIRQRITAEVERVWERVEEAPEALRDELVPLFLEAAEPVPAARRAAAALVEGRRPQEAAGA